VAVRPPVVPAAADSVPVAALVRVPAADSGLVAAPVPVAADSGLVAALVAVAAVTVAVLAAALVARVRVPARQRAVQVAVQVDAGVQAAPVVRSVGVAGGPARVASRRSSVVRSSTTSPRRR
jgi:hypothetical protein